MLIDCDTCRVRGAECTDCVVTMLLGPSDAGPDLTDSEATALAALADGGLVPALRWVPFGPPRELGRETLGAGPSW